MLTLTGYFILSVQVMLMFPIIVNELAGTPAAVKWMYAIEAALSLTLLYPLARWSEKHFRLETRLMAGLFLMSLSMFPVALTHSLHVLFAIICLFYLGSVIAEPARKRSARHWRIRAHAAVTWASAVWGWHSAVPSVIPAAAGCMIWVKKCNYLNFPGFTRYNRADYADSTLPPV